MCKRYEHITNHNQNRTRLNTNVEKIPLFIDRYIIDDDNQSKETKSRLAAIYKYNVESRK